MKPSDIGEDHPEAKLMMKWVSAQDDFFASTLADLIEERHVLQREWVHPHVASLLMSMHEGSWIEWPGADLAQDLPASLPPPATITDITDNADPLLVGLTLTTPAKY